MSDIYSGITSFLSNQNFLGALVIILSFCYFFYRKSKIHFRIKSHRNKEGIVVYKAEHKVWLFGKWNADYLGINSKEQTEKKRALYILMGWKKKEDEPSKEEKKGGNCTYEYYSGKKVKELENNLLKPVDNV
jgi:hypothetical protein